MGLDVIKKALGYRAVQWGRVYNKQYDMAVFVNDHIGGAIISNGKYEKDFLEITSEALEFLTGDKDFREGVCLDIGANIGNHSLHYSGIFKQILSFEPNPIAYKLLEANILKNRINNIEIHRVALGFKKEKKVLTICDENLGMSSLVQDTAGGSHIEFEIDIEVGDNLIEEAIKPGSVISFIKIDVEGFEDDALQGLNQTILKHNPVIAIELNFKSLSEPTKATMKRLLSLGYKEFYIPSSTNNIKNKYLNFIYRIFFTEKYTLSKLEIFDEVDYQQVYCTK